MRLSFAAVVAVLSAGALASAIPEPNALANAAGCVNCQCGVITSQCPLSCQSGCRKEREAEAMAQSCSGCHCGVITSQCPAICQSGCK